MRRRAPPPRNNTTNENNTSTHLRVRRELGQRLEVLNKGKESDKNRVGAVRFGLGHICPTSKPNVFSIS